MTLIQKVLAMIAAQVMTLKRLFTNLKIWKT